MTNSLELASRAKLRGYVQRVAFQMTLSEPMIRMLRIVRDYPAHKNNRTIDEYNLEHTMTDMRADYHADLFIREFRAIEARGLAYYNPTTKDDPWPEGHIFYKLTRAGELMCELLIECGLMRGREIIGFDSERAA